jgi:outer membrane protein TolC
MRFCEFDRKSAHISLPCYCGGTSQSASASSGTVGWGHTARLVKTLPAVATIISFVLLCGCVNQHAEVQTYRNILDAGQSKPATYQSGQLLTLWRAMELANLDNEQIAISGENYLQALINKNRAVAAFLPTVSFQPGFTVEQQPAIGTNPPGPATPADVNAAAKSSGFIASGNTWHSFYAPVVGNMTLSPPAFGNLASAEEQIEQQKQLLIDAQETVLLNVAQTYYQVLTSEQQVRVLRDSLSVDEARLVIVKGQYANHLALALEVSQTEAQVAGTRADLRQAITDVKNGRHTLAFLIGVPAVDGPLSDDVVVPSNLLGVDDYRAIAAGTRQDLLAADAGVRAAKASVDAAIAEYYPTVSLNVTGFLYRQYFSDASKWDAILMANVPIFSAGIIEADVREAWSKLRQAALYQAMLRRQIDQDVQTAYDNLTSSQGVLSDLAEQVKAAADAREQSGQLLDNGLAIPLDVLVAQNTLLDARLVYTSENFDRTIFYLDLLRITGQLGPGTGAHWPTSRPVLESPPKVNIR